MQNNAIKFLTGGIETINKKNQDGTPVVPIVPGQVYFAMSYDNQYGYIIYDVSDDQRVIMSTKAEIAYQTSHSLTIGDKTFDGSQDIVIPIYDGSSNK